MNKIAQEVRSVRAALGESVAEFGARFQRSGRSVEQWEQGRREPDPLVMVGLRQLANRRGVTARPVAAAARGRKRR